MRCERCKKQFVGDTPYCPKCEATVFLDDVQKLVEQSIDAVLRYVKLSTVLHAVLLVGWIVITVLFSHIRFVTSLLMIVAVLQGCLSLREWKIWTAYRQQFRTEGFGSLAEELRMERVKGLYRDCAYWEDYGARTLFIRHQYWMLVCLGILGDAVEHEFDVIHEFVQEGDRLAKLYTTEES